MKAAYAKLKGIVTAFAVTVSIVGLSPVVADAQEAEEPVAPQARPEVDVEAEVEADDLRGADEAELLRRLAGADAADAIRIDRELQALWRKSGSASMDLLFSRAREALEEADLNGAIDHLTALTDHAPDFAEGWHMRATAYYRAELFGPAVADLERTLALNPNNYRAIFGLGAILETFGDEKRAYQAYLRAEAIHPHFEDVIEALDRLRPGVEGQTL